jgi:hypothetical protein
LATTTEVAVGRTDADDDTTAVLDAPALAPDVPATVVPVTDPPTSDGVVGLVGTEEHAVSAITVAVSSTATGAR